MKVVAEARLWFQEGSSDKVYEVDLVEVATGQYVVNFRYGRRGSALRDGTKTATPVALDKARSIYAALVAEKEKGGYRATPGGPPTGAVPTPPRRSAPTAASLELTRRALLTRLQQGHRGEGSLHVVVRKVGDLGIREAEPMLLELLAAAKPPAGMKEDVFRHVLIRALARCGSSTSVAPLEKVAKDAGVEAHLRDVARIALSMIWGEAGRAQTVALAREALTPELRAALDGKDATRLVALLEETAANAPAQARAAVVSLYLVAGGADVLAKTARTAVIAAARVWRFSRAEIGAVRALFWAAELRRDGELYALLARRIENHRGREVFRQATRNYLRRRVARTLRQLAAIESPDYVLMASAILESYRDSDAEDAVVGEWGQYDVFARYHALNQILYGNSARYERAHHFRAVWKCKGRYRPGGARPTGREESYPKLWDRAPAELWRVARRRVARIVAEFASRALQDHMAFLATVPSSELADAMATAHPLTQAVAFDAAKTRTIDAELARGAAASTIDEAHAWVHAWVQANPHRVILDPAWLALLATARGEAVRESLVHLARAHAIAPEVAQAAVEQIVAMLMGFTSDDAARAVGAVATTVRVFDALLGGVSLPIAQELLAHVLAPVADLGGEIVLRRARAGHLPNELIDALLASPHASVRAIGARILAETPPEIMKDHAELLVAFSLSDNAELRHGMRALLGDVARRYPDVGTSIAGQLVDALLRALPEGAPAHVVSLLRHELANVLPRRDKKTILGLVGALSPHAREAGGLLLSQLTVDDLGLDEIARLFNNEVLLVRQGAWKLATAAKDRFKIAPVALARLCDAKWDDSRDFAFGIVRGLGPAELSVDAIIAICDSVKPLVQALGQSLMLAHFRTEDAGRYLVRLAEHPSTNIQLLVSGLLDRHARGDAKTIEQLIPYLYTVLSQVNRGGVAKQRVIDFVREQSVASPELAALLGPVLDRQSATNAVTQKHPLIAAMVDVVERHPEVPLPLAIVAPKVHGGEGAV